MNKLTMKIYLHLLVLTLIFTMAGCATTNKDTSTGDDVVVPFPTIDGTDEYAYKGSISTEKDGEKLEKWLEDHSEKFYQNNPEMDLYEGEGNFEVTAEMDLPTEKKPVTFTVQYDYMLRYDEGAWQYYFNNILLRQTENGVVTNSLEKFVGQYESQEMLNASTSNYLTSLYEKIDKSFKERIDQLK